ncbi:MAG: AAA family ATPase [Pirellulaceae bacterium]|nr:AAA family ATPase [Pirellulaceae bacterium]
MFPKMRKVSIYGLLRIGETVNIIAPPKTGKSWGAADLAIHKATGRKWLDNFECEPGLVVILDNELHGETIAHRLPQVAEARGIAFDDYADKIQVVSLRGHLCDVYGIGDVLKQFPADELDGALVVVDAFYRILPPGVSENDNGAIANIYNEIDRLAMTYGCSFCLIHHSTKGNQAAKAVTDVGAGAGSQARATDTHLILRAHAEQGHYVLEAAVRSWAPVEPLVLKWDWPVWQLATGLDASQLKTDKPTPANRLEQCKAAILKSFVHYPDGATKRKIQEHTGRPTVWQQALAELLDAGDVVTCEIPNPTHKKADSGYKRVYTNDDDI